MFVRRAFTYVAGENWGLVRIGMADGVIGIFDNGVTSGQFLINGFGGGDLNSYIGSSVPFFFLSTQGAEYDNTKAGLSVTADRRLRLRPPVGAERVERLLPRQQRRRRWQLNHRRRHQVPV